MIGVLSLLHIRMADVINFNRNLQVATDKNEIIALVSSSAYIFTYLLVIPNL